MNLRSAFMMTKFALPHLQKTRGNIVSAGSESGIIGLAQNTPYGGTKGWMHAFMRGLAVEQAQNGVRANCVCPGPIDTAWTHKETGPMDQEDGKQSRAGCAVGAPRDTGRGRECLCVSCLRGSKLRHWRALSLSMAERRSQRDRSAIWFQKDYERTDGQNRTETFARWFAEQRDASNQTEEVKFALSFSKGQQCMQPLGMAKPSPFA